MHRSAATAAAMIALVAATPAYAVGDAPAPPPEGLFLTAAGEDNAWTRGVRLTCAPTPDGPHPDAAAACQALDMAGGDLDRLPGEARACTKIYEPVTVSAQGEWRGRPTSWQKTYANSCELDVATGALFRF
ncbi:SSI family serine proteinase inhibitor [Streptomyces sp. NPDC051907]|uniref:SSI family serine proteinase inhibitor n=1 Tax=Streptomyces sp. NPDC051907 TaxID=3155284 RepID=UPI00343D125B